MAEVHCPFVQRKQIEKVKHQVITSWEIEISGNGKLKKWNISSLQDLSKCTWVWSFKFEYFYKTQVLSICGWVNISK